MPTNLPPGRELDILLAEKVMGWKRQTRYGRPLHTTETRKRPGQAAVAVEVDDFDAKGDHVALVPPEGKLFYLCSCGGDEEGALPNYSTDLTSAWLIVDHLAALHHGVEVKRWGEDYHECRVWERITPEMVDQGRTEPPREWNRMGETTPHAICLAALAALGYKEG